MEVANVDVAALGASPPNGGATAASHPYTCNTCAVAYRNIDLQRGHMKSDWHRYNLKRRVASLPPIASEIFNEKVLQARAAQSAEAEKAMFERTCDACQKSYSSENAYQNHLTSQKHKVRVASIARRKGPIADDASSVMSSTFSLGEPMAIEKELDSEAEEEFTAVVEGLKKANIDEPKDERPSPVKRPSNPHLSAQGQHAGDDASINRESDSTTPVPSSKQEIAWTLKSCLFCNYESPTVELNANHMERFHDMFIPEKQYLVDLEGLLQHLQERIHEGHQCLYCFKTKKTAFAVQTHMRDKGHCKIPYDTEEVQLDIGDFYDFRSTYSDGEESDEEEEADENGGAKLGLKRPTKLVGEDGEELEDGADEGWETDSDASSLDSDDLTAFTADGKYEQFERLDKHPHHSRDDPRAHHQVDGWHSHAHKHTRAVFYDDYELHLPSGKSVGHRAHKTYYRQNLHNYPSAEERAERLAIEAAGSGDEMDVDGREVATTGNPKTRNQRAIARRDAAGMTGVSDHAKRVAKEEATRGRSAATRYDKRRDYKVSEKNNNQKNFYYRYQAGG